MHQPRVGDLSFGDVESREFGQRLEMCQPGVGDPSGASQRNQSLVNPFTCMRPASLKNDELTVAT